MKKILTAIAGLLTALYTYAATVTVDVMVVYDNSAAAYLTNNGLNQNDFASNVINQLQTPYNNSGLDIEFNVVHTMAIGYNSVAGPDGNGIANDLTHVSSNAAVQAARVAHNADLVQMLVNLNHPATGAWTAGIAYDYNGFPMSGYSVVSIQDIGSGISGTAAHEIGHNFGALHDSAHITGNPPPLYARGYLYSASGTNYYTVMAYGSLGYVESPYFSTPCKQYPAGTPVGVAGSANNTRVISKNMGSVASYYGAAQTSTEIIGCPSTYTVTPQTNGTGTGTLNCNPLNAASGSEVTCTANPNSNSYTASWSGVTCKAGTGNGTDSCKFDLTANITVTATFTLNPTVTVVPSVGGNITCTPTAGAPGTAVNCNAIADGGFYFDAWSGGTCSGSNTTCNFNLGIADVTVSGTFSALPPGNYTVTTAFAANGSITCSPTSGAAGTTVTCTAAPAAGYQLSAWSGACSGNISPCTFTLTGNAAVGATFTTVATYTVTTGTTTNGTIACSPTSGVAGTVVTCTATPAAGYQLSAWSGACSGNTSLCTFVLTGDAAVGAIFFNNPNVVPNTVNPVPSTGLLGLFAMVLSLLSAVFVTIRRKR